MKKIIQFFFAVFLILSVPSCSTKQIKNDHTIKSEVTRTLAATVLSQKGVIVGEFESGPKIIGKNIPENILTWSGFHLLLRTETGDTYEYLSKELYYEGDRVLAKIQNGRVLSVKYSP